MIWLEKLRKEKNLTQSQVSEMSKISISFYNQIENAERKPSVSTAKKIAEVLSFDWTKFFEKGD